MKIKLLALSALCFILFGILGYNRLYPKKIMEIYVYHCNLGSVPEQEYKIDLSSKLFYHFNSENGDTRDTTYMEPLRNEDYPHVNELYDENIQIFLEECSKNRFSYWKNWYDNDYVLDGHQWTIVITYSDNIVKEIKGSNAYPNTWDKMFKAFKDLTGEDVLHLESDWLLEDE